MQIVVSVDTLIDYETIDSLATEEDIKYIEDIIENLKYAPTWLLRGGY